MTRAQQFTFTVDHTVGESEIELEVTYSMTPGRPEWGPQSCPWGGQPAEGPECELVSITHDGQPFKLSDAEEEALLDKAYERCERDWEDDCVASEEYRAEQRADDRMMDRWERGE